MYKFCWVNIFFAAIALFAISPEGYSQCEGPFNDGNPNMLPTGPIFTTISDGDFFFDLLVTGEVMINSLTGVSFLEGDPGKVENLAMGDEIGPLSSYNSGPLEVFNITTLIGPFGGGFGGFIGVLKDGKYGWIELEACGNRECSPDVFEYRIINRCLNGLPDISVNAGDENTILPPNAIPTLSQWSLVILALLILIIGTLATSRERFILKTQ